MRIIVVPLTSSRAMVFCQKTMPIVRQTPRIDERLAQRVLKTWNGFAAGKQKWRQTIVGWANAALERIPYQEWALRTFPATNSVVRTRQGVHVDPSVESLEKGLDPVSVEYCSKMSSVETVRSQLQALAEKGIAHHQRMFWLCLVGAPLTLPFAAVPIVPNIPGFYLLYRVWSHWKAGDGARHLQYLLRNDQLRYEASECMDKVISSDLTDHEVDLVVDGLHVAELGPELHRAIRQVKRLK